MRRTRAVALFAGTVLVAGTVPVVSLPAVQARPVTPVVERLTLQLVDGMRAAPAPDVASGAPKDSRRLLGQVTTSRPFAMAALTWPRAANAGALSRRSRCRCCVPTA